MSKIKLLILLLINFLILSCNNTINDNNKFAISYIGGEYDGLVFKNLLHSHLNSFKMLDSDSDFIIVASIDHSTDLFITNIDNTSDREKVSSSMSFEVLNKKKDCTLIQGNRTVSQFYIYASGDKFLSNKNALKKIKESNSETLTKYLINELNDNVLDCAK